MLILSVNVIMYYLSQIFFTRESMCGGEILRLTKWKLQELKWKFSFLKHLKKLYFKLLFLLLKNVMWVFPCWCYKYLLINLFSFGDVNSVLVNSPSKKTLYFKDLKCVYFACQGLSYGKEDQMLFIDNELIKALQILSVVVSSLNFLKEINCQRIRCSGWASLLICVILIVIGKRFGILYEIIVKYSKPFLISSPKYS